jgi:tetratricopeptide (TPR) repeat protein
MIEAAHALRTAQDLLGQGDAEAAISLFTAAADASDVRCRFMALLGLSRACSSVGALAEAEDAARRAIATVPDDCTGHALLALALIDRNRLDDAADAAAMAVARAPAGSGHAPPLLNLSARIAVLRGRLKDALALVDQCLAARPFDRRALSYRPALARGLGVPDTAAASLDFATLVQVTRPAPPAGFDDRASFNASVAANIAASPALSLAQPGRTLVGGSRLPSIAMLRPDFARALRGLFREAVEQYAGSPPERDAQPMIGDRPARFDIGAWASVMAEGAHELPHIHEGGWISGVYYPEMPPADDNDAHAGAILFGGHDLPEALLPPGPVRAHRPMPGEMVLFPSWLHHRTLPFRGPGQRISVAFDAQPGR